MSPKTTEKEPPGSIVFDTTLRCHQTWLGNLLEMEVESWENNRTKNGRLQGLK